MTRPDPSSAALTTIQVETTPPYDILIGPGVRERLPEWLSASQLASRYAVVTDSNVAALHAGPLRSSLEAAGLSVVMIVIPPGEAAKTRATKAQVEDTMLEAGCGRDTVIIALGGGVITDLAGFVAATYHRGIPYVQAPTTLLAMVDSSIGGKTGVDHPRGKNLIGAFHQPSAVFIDTDTLTTLPDSEFRSGLAEVVKTAVIADAALFERLTAQADSLASRDASTLSEIIARACAIKARVIAADEKEGDLRKILNFGHTIGHALETLSGYTLRHGDAVAIGMVAESRIAAKAGLLPEPDARAIESALSGLGLPTALPALAPVLSSRAILEAARMDKKTRGGRTYYALPCAVGRMARGPRGHGIDVQDDMVVAALSEMPTATPAP